MVPSFNDLIKHLFMQCTESTTQAVFSFESARKCRLMDLSHISENFLIIASGVFISAFLYFFCTFIIAEVSWFFGWLHLQLHMAHNSTTATSRLVRIVEYFNDNSR